MARIVCKQELTYPNNVIIDNSMQDYYNKFYVTVDNKIKMADISLKFAKKYDAISSVGSDLLYSMKKLQIERQTSSLNKDKLRLLIDSIKSGNVLNVDNYFDEDVNLNDEISELIALYNDLICSNDKGNGLAFGSYSALVEEHSSLKEQYLLLKEELLQVKDRLDIVSKQNMDLQEQNALYRQQVDIYEDASKRALALIKNKEK